MLWHLPRALLKPDPARFRCVSVQARRSARFSADALAHRGHVVVLLLSHQTQCSCRAPVCLAESWPIDRFFMLSIACAPCSKQLPRPAPSSPAKLHPQILPALFLFALALPSLPAAGRRDAISQCPNLNPEPNSSSTWACCSSSLQQCTLNLAHITAVLLSASPTAI